MLKSRLLGENPCHTEKLFRKIMQFGGHARLGGGVCGVEMALMDLAYLPLSLFFLTFCSLFLSGV